MKIKQIQNIIVIALCFIALAGSAYAQQPFQKEYGYQNRNNWAQSGGRLTVLQTHDSGFAALSFGAAINGAGTIILKTNSEGNTEWCKVVKVFPAADLYPSAIIQTLDSGFCIVGSFITSKSLPFLFKTDRFGNKMFLKVYGDTVVNFGGFRSLAEGNDGSLYLAGINFLYKTDKEGNLIWANKYSESGSTIQKTNDGSFVRAGAGLTKIDTAGNILWAKKYFESSSPGNHVRTLQDGGYLFCTARGTGAIKTDSVGNVLWAKDYGGSFTGGIDELYRGRFVIATYENGGLDAFRSTFTIIDSLGNILISKYPQKNDNIIFSVKRTYDSGFVAEVGYGYVGDKASILKVDKNGITSCPQNERILEPFSQDWTLEVTIPAITDTLLQISASELPCKFLPVDVTAKDICTSTDIAEEVFKNEVEIYPNPASGTCTILLKDEMETADVAILDIRGKTLYRHLFKSAEGRIMLDISPLMPGVYFVKVNEKNVQKLVIE